MTEKNHYEVLGINETASEAEIHAASKKRMLETHPDKGGTAAEFNAVYGARTVLSDPKKKEKYDNDLKKNLEKENEKKKNNLNEANEFANQADDLSMFRKQQYENSMASRNRAMKEEPSPSNTDLDLNQHKKNISQPVSVSQKKDFNSKEHSTFDENKKNEVVGLLTTNGCTNVEIKKNPRTEGYDVTYTGKDAQEHSFSINQQNQLSTTDNSIENITNMLMSFKKIHGNDAIPEIRNVSAETQDNVKQACKNAGIDESCIKMNPQASTPDATRSPNNQEPEPSPPPSPRRP